MLEIVKAIGQEQMKSEIPAFEIGDTVRVHNRIVEGKNERIQIFSKKKRQERKKIWEIKYCESLNGRNRRKRVAEKKQKKGFRF